MNQMTESVKECSFSYSDLDDSLIVSCKEENENIRENFGLGNFIFSLTGKGKIVGIQILNASEILPEYNIDPNNLEELENVKITTSIRGGCLFIGLILSFEESESRISVPLMNLA